MLAFHNDSLAHYTLINKCFVHLLVDKWKNGYGTNILIVINSWTEKNHNHHKNQFCHMYNGNRHACFYGKILFNLLPIRDNLQSIIPALPEHTTFSLLTISSTYNILKFLKIQIHIHNVHMCIRTHVCTTHSNDPAVILPLSFYHLFSFLPTNHSFPISGLLYLFSHPFLFHNELPSASYFSALPY